MPVLPFLGKWSLAQSSQSIVIDPSTGVLSGTASPTSPYANFNAYGVNARFCLQGMNGKYITWNGSAYIASVVGNGQANLFAVEDAGSGNLRIVDLGVGGGGQTQYYWSLSGGALGQIAKTGSPPASTLFTQTVVTVGLASFPQFSTPSPDLTWVDLTNADLTGMSIPSGNFSNGVLDNVTVTAANFSAATFNSTSMKGINGVTASFSGATMNGADLTGANLPAANLDHLKLPNTTLTGASFQGATLTNATATPGVKAQRVDFSGSGAVQFVDFTGADLSGAKLNCIVLSNCSFNSTLR